MTDDKVKARIAAWLAEPGVTATQRQLQDDVRALQAEGAELAGEVTDYEQAFKLRWDADMRAIKRWQAEAPGRELTWPDHADLCVWLMGRIDAAEAKLTALVEAARPLAQSADHHDATDRHYKIKRGDKATVSIPLGWLRQIRQALAHHSAPVVEGVPGICGETGEPCSKADQDCAHDCLGKPPSHPKAAPPATPTSAPVEDVGGLVAELSNLLERATPGPWQLQDGCSWRRIGTSEHDGNVLCPTKNPRDGHPDLMAGRGEDTYANLNLICAAVNALPALLAALSPSLIQPTDGQRIISSAKLALADLIQLQGEERS